MAKKYVGLIIHVPPRMEFETGAPNLTTAFDDNVSFFVISSNFNYSH